jgi:hypothetical protein
MPKENICELECATNMDKSISLVAKESKKWLGRIRKCFTPKESNLDYDVASKKK